MNILQSFDLLSQTNARDGRDFQSIILPRQLTLGQALVKYAESTISNLHDDLDIMPRYLTLHVIIDNIRLVLDDFPK